LRRSPGWTRSERATVGLAAVAIAGAGAVVVDQFGRLLGRRARQLREHEQLELGPVGAFDTVEAAAIDTVEAAVRGYTAAPRSETVLFNLLAGFLGSFAFVRLSTYGIRRRRGPFRNVSIGGRHIHHFVPGILLAFGSGIAALVSDDDELEQALAVPMGAGIGLTFDEAALLLDLRDVYWTREGLLSVQLSLGATAILSIAIITLRMLRRGEAQLLEDADVAAELAPAGAGALA
jgi:hypothetical protein